MSEKRITYSDGGRNSHHHETKEVIEYYLRHTINDNGTVNVNKMREAAYNLGSEDGWSDGYLPVFITSRLGNRWTTDTALTNGFDPFLGKKVDLEDAWHESWTEGFKDRAEIANDARMDAMREIEIYGEPDYSH